MVTLPVSTGQGLPAKEAVEHARQQVAGLLQCSPDEIVFTSGGSESNNHAIKGVFLALRGKSNHIITTQIEHTAVINPCRFLENLGAEVPFVPVDRYGSVDPQDIQKAITPRTILITVMHANNEVGTIQPIEEISKIAKERGIVFHTDAAQSVGKIVTKVDHLGIDLLSIAGHKLYAPKGIGALYIRKGAPLGPLIHGAGHESGRRAGTENVLLIVGLGKACEVANRYVEGVMVDYYGTPTPLNQVAKLSIPEPTMVVAQPFDPSAVGAIEKAIMCSDLGLNPSNDGKLVRIPIPALTEERRKQLVKKVHGLGEEAKTAIRMIRRDANEDVKRHQKDGDLAEDDARRLLDEIQKKTDRFSAEIDQLCKNKERELMEV